MEICGLLQEEVFFDSLCDEGGMNYNALVYVCKTSSVPFIRIFMIPPFVLKRKHIMN